MLYLASSLLASGLVFSSPLVSTPTRTTTVIMKGPAKLAPKGPLGGSKKPGAPSGWLGDNSKSAQIRAYEEGTDYLFFQGPAPKSAVQEDLPNFFSLEDLAEAKLEA